MQIAREDSVFGEISHESNPRDASGGGIQSLREVKFNMLLCDKSNWDK